jgi:hypothetical protein
MPCNSDNSTTSCIYAVDHINDDKIAFVYHSALQLQLEEAQNVLSLQQQQQQQRQQQQQSGAAITNTTVIDADGVHATTTTETLSDGAVQVLSQPAAAVSFDTFPTVEQLQQYDAAAVTQQQYAAQLQDVADKLALADKAKVICVHQKQAHRI